MLIITAIIISPLLIISSNGSGQGTIYKIGDKGPAGGLVFYDKGNNNGNWRYLEVSTEDQGRAVWGCYKTSIPGARDTSIGSGKANTRAIITDCSEKDTAAMKCTLYRGGGRDDWFLPSKNELNVIYHNLHKAAIGDFDPFNYWSSSEEDASYAWNQHFKDGTPYDSNKSYSLRFRAIRAF